MFTDLRQALRLLIKNPGFSALVMIVLALGIGANTAIFSIVNGVLLKPLPFTDASRLVSIADVVRGEEQDGCSFPDFVDWRQQSKTMDRMAAYTSNTVTMTGRGDATALQVANVTSDLLPLLGVKPLLGRSLSADDDAKGAQPVAVISESAWEHRFGRSDSILGQPVTFDGVRFTIVGVMPAAFQFPIQVESIEAWMPVGALALTSQWMAQRGAHFIRVIGHVRPGTTIDQANAELATISANLAAAYPASNGKRGAKARPLMDNLVREYRLGLTVLLGAVAAVLLIACANVANLLLARGTTRQKEMAIRAAMGASRSRLIRQLLTESLLLAIGGGALGALVAMWGLARLVAASPLSIPRLHDVSIDRTVLLFTFLASALTGVLFGLAPAIHLSGADAGETLKDAGRGSSGTRSARTRTTLVIAEVAVSLVLLAGAGLLGRSLVALQRVDPGFVAEHAITTDLSLPETRYPTEAAQIAFYHRLLDAMNGLPGAGSSAIATTLPLSGSELGIGFTIEGRPVEPGVKTSAAYFSVSPDYFKTMGIRLVAGRTFTDRDNQDGPSVVIISETMARRHWPGENALGKRLTIGVNKSGPREIIGIVADVKQVELSEKRHPDMYTAFLQTPWPFLSVVVRTVGDPAALGGALRSAIVALDRDQPVGKVKTVTEYMQTAVAAPRFTAMLIGSFAVFALVLAGFGLFSVMAYAVAQRRREIGIRMALGAQAADVRSLVIGQALRMGAAGVTIGLAGALLVSRILDSLLFGVTAGDPATFAGVSIVLIAVLLVAAYLPARRATRVNPMVALRAE